MTDNVVSIDTDRAEMIGVLRELVAKAESGELETFVGVGLVSVKGKDAGDVLSCQCGIAPSDLFVLIGALESLKSRLCLKDEAVYETVMELARDCW